MSREKQGYRDQLVYFKERLEELYPERTPIMLTTEQVAEVLGCNVKTVISNINKRYNPLPAKNIGTGRKIYRVAVTDLARWSIGG